MADLIIILDESGSMEASLGKEALGAVNSFINDQKGLVPDSKLSFWKFNNKATQLLDCVPLDDVSEITDYHPCGGTALHDAIGMAITKMKDHTNVTVLIVSDGQENASQEFRGKVKEMVEQKKQWKFIYIGANQNSMVEGESVGIKNCCDVAKGELGRLSRQLSERVGEYRPRSQTQSNAPPPLITRQVAKGASFDN